MEHSLMNKDLSATTVLLLLAAIIIGPSLRAQQMPTDPSSLFEKRSAMIPMRDGLKLYTEIYTPKNTNEALPILMNRTPYGIASANGGITDMLFRYADMVPDGYIFVFQDIRGRHNSE